MPKARPKKRTDYLVNLDIQSGGEAPADPYAEILVMTLIPRIRITRATGVNHVAFHYGDDFSIRVDRIIAERLRNDLTKWLEKNPGPR
jgi:hypothetical protein